MTTLGKSASFTGPVGPVEYPPEIVTHMNSAGDEVRLPKLQDGFYWEIIDYNRLVELILHRADGSTISGQVFDLPEEGYLPDEEELLDGALMLMSDSEEINYGGSGDSSTIFRPVPQVD